MATNFQIGNGDDLSTLFASGSTTISAGNGLVGGGDLTDSRTIAIVAGSGLAVTADDISHADTSDETNTSNSGNTVVQNIELDEFGHITAITSATLSTGGGTGDTTIIVRDGDGTDAVLDDGKYWQFVEGSGININWTDTSTGDGTDPYDLTFDVVSAPKWTTARTLTTTLTGDVTGSASMSVDGSGNRTVTVNTTVGNDSHSHSSVPKWTTARTLTTTLTGDVTGSGSMSVDGSGNKTATISCNVSSITGNLTVNGTISATGDLRAYQSSDIRLKDVIETVSDASAKLNTLDSIKFTYKDDEDSIVHTGFIAQQVQEIMPELVSEDDEGMLKIKVGGHEIVSMLVAAHKEHSVELKSLKDEIEEIKKLISK